MAIFNSILFFYEIVTQPTQGLQIKRLHFQLPPPSPVPSPTPFPTPISGKQQREPAEEEPEAPGPLPRLSSSGLTLILSQRRLQRFARPRALKPMHSHPQWNTRFVNELRLRSLIDQRGQSVAGRLPRDSPPASSNPRAAYRQAFAAPAALRPQFVPTQQAQASTGGGARRTSCGICCL